MSAVRTLSFNDLELPADPLFPTELPGYVPQVDTKEITSFDPDLASPAYAIGLRRVFSEKSWTIVPGFSAVTSHEALGLTSDHQTVLVGYGKDPLVEAFWTRRKELIPKIAEQQWSLVLTCNYSMYGNHPRTEHLMSFRRNLQLAVEMRFAGVPALPNIYWYRLEDLNRYADWAYDFEPEAIAINLQTFRTEQDWEEMALPGLHYIASQLPPATRLVVTGSSRIDRIKTLTDLFPGRLHLVSGNALMTARHGGVMTADGRDDVHALTADAFKANVEFYNSLIKTS